jgi:hypothetical protein
LERTVDEAQFWQVIDTTLRRSNQDTDVQAQALREVLVGLPDAEVLGFHRRLAAANHELYTWTHMAAVELVEGPLGDDGFTDFRTFVVATGRLSFERFRNDPDTLLDVLGQRGIELAEPFGAVADEVYLARTGRCVSQDGADPLEPWYPPAGDRAVLDDAAQRRRQLPRLSARYG